MFPAADPAAQAYFRRRQRPRRHVTRVLALSAAALILSVSAATAQAPGVKAKPPRAGWPAAAPLGTPPLAGAFTTQPVNEVEPNNSAATAQLIRFPDEVLGAIDPAGDVDFFALDLEAGVPLEVEVFSERLNSGMDSYLALIAPDGTTIIAESDDAVGLDSRIRAHITQAGRYYVALVDLFSRGGPNFHYRLVFSRAVTGPGDPTTLFASNLGSAWQTAAAPGALYMIDQGGRIVRLSNTGTATTFLTGIGVPYDVVIDGYGALLVAGLTNQLEGVVTRVDLASGARTQLIGGLSSAASITVGPDGDIWVADTRAARILRYDAAGTERSSLNTAGTHGQTVLDLAFSPGGVLYYSNMIDAIYRVVNGVPQRVIQGRGFGGIAFDAAGNLYVGTVDRGVLLYSASHELLHDPFAISGLSLTGSLVFLRDASGAMTSRLLGVNLGDGTMREMNPAAMRAPGFRIGADLLTITSDSLRRARMGFPYSDTLRIAETAAGVGVVWSLADGRLPRGVTLSPAGVLSGVPEEAGTFRFTARVVGGGRSGARVLTLEVVRPAVQLAAAINHLLGMPGQLTPDEARYLDLQGNRNGRFDIGDLKAFRRFLDGHTKEER